MVEEDLNGKGLAVSFPDGHDKARVEARTTLVAGEAYLVPIFTGQGPCFAGCSSRMYFRLRSRVDVAIRVAPSLERKGLRKGGG